MTLTPGRPNPGLSCPAATDLVDNVNDVARSDDRPELCRRLCMLNVNLKLTYILV